MHLRVVIVLPESNPDGHSIAAHIADAIDCSVFSARGIRAGLSLIAREKPEMAMFEEQYIMVEGRPVAELVNLISPDTKVVFVNTTRRAASTTSAGE